MTESDQDPGRAAAWPPTSLSLGRVVATPGALRLLKRHEVNPADLLCRHQTGDYGDLCREDRASNRRAALAGARVLSAYLIGNKGERIWVLTDAIDDEGVRRCTTLLLPSEY
ncbi:MAG: hypothetical protein J0L58_10580 [Burkholderiales bacterium]|nr:hypothetical protein [Burkholderiales bacterium]